MVEKGMNSLDADKILREKMAESLGVRTYFELLESVGAKRVNTREFRRKFNRFCMVRRGEAWQGSMTTCPKAWVGESLT